MDRLDAGGGDEDRERELLAHDRRLERPLLRLAGDVRREPELSERRDVVRERHPGLGARQQREIDRSRQGTLRAPLRLRHAFKPASGHG